MHSPTRTLHPPPRARAATAHAPAHHGHTEAAVSWLPLVVLAVAQFMVILDVTVVNVALPSIGTALGFDAGDLSRVVTAYVLFTGGLMLLGGRMADLLGARRVFSTGLLVFTGASAAAGLAEAPDALVAARAVQGIGAAMLLPAALALVATTYSGHQRAVALAVWGALGSAGAAAGVLLGGIITSLASWEWIFFVNVPIGIALAVALPRVIRRADPKRARSGGPDLAGAATVMAGLVALVYGVDGAAEHGWGATRTLVPVAGGIALLALFAAIERRVASPLVAPGTFAARPLRAGAVVMLGATGILVGAFFLNTLFLQEVLGFSALETGLAFLPLTVVILAGAHVASHLLPRLGSRVLMTAGLLISAGGAVFLTGAPNDAAYVADLLPGFLALGFGIGLTFVSVSVTAMHDVAHERAGLTSGIMTTAHEVGAALGVAVLASVALGGDTGLAYHDGFLVAAGVAVALAAVAALLAPAVRPAPGAKASMH